MVKGIVYDLLGNAIASAVVSVILYHFVGWPVEASFAGGFALLTAWGVVSLIVWRRRLRRNN